MGTVAQTGGTDKLSGGMSTEQYAQALQAEADRCMSRMESADGDAYFALLRQRRAALTLLEALPAPAGALL